eukprot:ctg_68.g70
MQHGRCQPTFLPRSPKPAVHARTETPNEPLRRGRGARQPQHRLPPGTGGPPTEFRRKTAFTFPRRPALHSDTRVTATAEATPAVTAAPSFDTPSRPTLHASQPPVLSTSGWCADSELVFDNLRFRERLAARQHPWPRRSSERRETGAARNAHRCSPRSGRAVAAAERIDHHELDETNLVVSGGVPASRMPARSTRAQQSWCRGVQCEEMAGGKSAPSQAAGGQPGVGRRRVQGDGGGGPERAHRLPRGESRGDILPARRRLDLEVCGRIGGAAAVRRGARWRRRAVRAASAGAALAATLAGFDRLGVSLGDVRGELSLRRPHQRPVASHPAISRRPSASHVQAVRLGGACVKKVVASDGKSDTQLASSNPKER